MNHKIVKCFEDELIVDFLLNNLTREEAEKLEEHFEACAECTKKARAYIGVLSTLSSLKSTKEHGKSLENVYWDALMLPAAGSHKNDSIAETRSLNNRFLLRLIPFMDEEKSILEITVLDKSIKGILTVENEFGVIFKSEISNGVASEEVQNPIDLRNAFIKIEDI